MCQNLLNSGSPTSISFFPFSRISLLCVGCMGNVVIDVLRIVDSGGNAGHISGAHARKFLKFGNLNRNIGDIALELHEIAVGGRPSVHPDYQNVKSGILSYELNEVGNLIGNALHAGFYQFLPSGGSGDACEHSGGLTVPIRGAEPCERGYKIGPVFRIGLFCQGAGFAGIGNESQIVLQPADDGAGIIQIALQDMRRAYIQASTVNDLMISL